ncbi:hypothetical protein FGL86_00935 [Pistricoccus aurantiacus]|uniref:Uncharacterized protein n=1 Tax=Pistricoccus aurantiacus TaxID=1883414 RepID=A0A5B8SSJ8_9GAMM|nr:hypothetical protein [Pistricoccus aurantiacus]QEA37770.1 hypothetical protein FGL86_00935 [Pistricoccus aurantiacus]
MSIARRVLILALAAALPVAAAAPVEDERVLSVQITGDEGPLAAGQPATVHLAARDPASGYPLIGLQPALWLVPASERMQSQDCAVWVSRLYNAPVPPLGAIDLNGFDLVEATADGRLALVDPQLNLATANIKAIETLGEVPVGWAIDERGDVLAAALHDARRVDFLSMEPFRRVQSADLPAAPTGLLEHGDTFWVPTDDGSVIQFAADGRQMSTFAVGDGHVFAGLAGRDGLYVAAADGRGAFLSGTGAASRFDLQQPVAATAFSALADSLFAIGADGDVLLRVARDAVTAPRMLPLSGRIRAITADPAGRFMALEAADRLSVTILDTESDRERWTIDTRDPLIGMQFSDEFLYLMHERQGGVTRVLFDPEGGPPGVAAIAAGSRSDALQRASILPMMARIPEVGMIVASTRDKAAYMLAEDGMQAAMSSLPLKAGVPAGILLRYRGLSPAAMPGSYEVSVVPRYGGPHLAVVRIEQPDLVHCARVEVAGPPRPAALKDDESTAVRVGLVVAGQPQEGQRQLRFAFTGDLPKTTLPQRALLMDARAGWRRIATRFKHEGDQIVADLEIAGAGPLRLFVEYRDPAGDLRTIATALHANEGGPSR